VSKGVRSPSDPAHAPAENEPGRKKKRLHQKISRFYADCRDRDGVRHRRAFTTAEEATAYEAERKQRNHPKPTR
jgi:hypothetical protein